MSAPPRCTVFFSFYVADLLCRSGAHGSIQIGGEVVHPWQALRCVTWTGGFIPPALADHTDHGALC